MIYAVGFTALDVFLLVKTLRIDSVQLKSQTQNEIFISMGGFIAVTISFSLGADLFCFWAVCEYAADSFFVFCLSVNL